jgi:inosose dehydratase
MKIGFGAQLWLMDNHYENFHRMLDELALIGFDGFEVCYPFLIEWYEHKPAELKKLLDLHGLELASYYTGIGFNTAGKRQRGSQEVQRRCRFLSALGCRYLLLDGGEKDFAGEFETLDQYIRCIAGVANELGEYAHSQGVILAWHQHWGSIFETEPALHRLMELTDPARVGFCPDVGQLVLCGMDPVAIVKQYAQRIQFIHFKDITFAGRPWGELWPGMKTPSDEGAYGIDSKGRWVELGRGVVPFPQITQLLREAGYDGWIVDDFDYSGYPAYASAKACKDYLNQGLGIWGERDLRAGQEA